MEQGRRLKSGRRFLRSGDINLPIPPAVLLTHGVNDPRVEVWNTTKTAARLLAATASERPVLMRLDYASGHGVGNTRSQVLDERADLFAFLFWQMGVPGWSPQP